ncbi:hypothetical protein CA850_01805 [Micromonospora echinospora]|nr:hypothetical protein CA850_01805 [Micromonospora echinospora]
MAILRTAGRTGRRPGTAARPTGPASPVRRGRRGRCGRARAGTGRPGRAVPAGRLRPGRWRWPGCGHCGTGPAGCRCRRGSAAPGTGDATRWSARPSRTVRPGRASGRIRSSGDLPPARAPRPGGRIASVAHGGVTSSEIVALAAGACL